MEFSSHVSPMEAEVKSDTKTRKRMEDVAADRVISRDSSSVHVDPDPTCLISFGDDSIGPPAFLCSRHDALVDKGAAAPKPRLSPMKMRTLTAVGGLLPSSTAYTAMRTIFLRPLFPWSFGEIKKRTSRTNNQLAPPLQMEGYSNEIKANSGVRSWQF